MGRNRPGKRRPKGLGKVLVLEDDAVLALAIEDALLAAGASQVALSATIAHAMEHLNDMRPDAIVIDVHLADRDDGWAIAELIPFIGTKPPRIVFSTGSPDEIPAHIAEIGPILAKPYSPQDIVVALKEPARPGLLDKIIAGLR